MPRSRPVRAFAARWQKESGISAPRLIATALAAVTMALISSRLTSITNSMILVAVVSVVSALVGEFYRVGVTLAAQRTKEAVTARVGLPNGETTEDAQTAVIEAVADTVEDEPGPGTDTVRAGSQGFWSVFWTGLRKNQTIQLAVVFLLVSGLTVGASYLVARAQGSTEIHNQTTIQNPVTIEELSDEEKAALIDLAVRNADRNLTEEVESLQTQIDDLTKVNEELVLQVEELQARLEETPQDQDLQTRITALEGLVQQLSDQISQLEQANTDTDAGDQTP